jgi:hypothetical protein
VFTLNLCHSERSEESAAPGSWEKEIPRYARNDKTCV